MFKFFYKLNLAKKLVLIYMSVIILAVGLLSITYYLSFRNALLERTFAQLSSINMLEKQHIEELFNTRYQSNTATLLDEVVKFDHLLYERTGMGNSGETYLVDDEFFMRSKSRFFPNVQPDSIIVKTEATLNLSKGIESQGVFDDYRGITVLSVYRLVEFDNGIEWFIISEMDMNEAMVPVLKVRNTLLWIGMYVLIAVIIITVYISRGISVPIKKVKQKIEKIASGQLKLDKVTYKGEDELGDISEAINQLITSLNKVINYTKEISEGNFESKYEPLSERDEFGIELSKTRERLIDLISKNEKLELENKRALLKGQENERIRLAQELHDGIGSLLTTAKMSLSSIEQNDEIKKQLKDLIDATVNEVRNISFNMMPSVLIDFGVGAAIKALIAQVEPVTDVSFDFENNIDPTTRFNRDMEINIYRIFQEAINNIVKHSKAQKVDMSLAELDNNIIILIEDDGVGFSKTDQNKVNSSGLRNIRERVKLLNGELHINSSKGGTSIEVEIPVIQ